MKETSQLMDPIANKMELLASISDPQSKELELSYQLFSLVVEQMTENDNVGFTTLFSRIAYLSTQNDLSGKIIFDCQLFRKAIESGDYKAADIAPLIGLGLHLIQQLSQKVHKYKWQKNYDKPDHIFYKKLKEPLEFQRIVKAAIVDVYDKELIVLLDEDSERKRSVKINESSFQAQLSQVKKFYTFPLVANLIDVNYLEDQSISANGFVIRPDLLIGVTSVSECFSASGATALKYLGRKLIPSDSSVHMLIGNVVNYYLDELIHDPSLEFKKVLKETFKIAPEMFSVMSDQEVKDCISKVNVHFNNLKSVVSTELAEAGITKERSYLEPSFYSNEFGLQGRLDLYHHDERAKKADIVELKSGKLYQAHKYGLNQNHYVQTLLYDLILESVHQAKVKSTNYILYSANDSKRLRFAPKVRGKQLEALRLRNSIMILEEILSQLDSDIGVDVLSKLDPKRIPEEYTFLRRDAKKFWEVYGRLSLIEKTYYKTYLAFISREFQLSKIGQHGIYASNGLASLWLDPMVEKADMFTILSLLEVIKNDSDLRVPTLTLAFTENSHRLSKFRVGDITILYPYLPDEPALSTQLFKCTILEIDTEKVVVRLRARQKNYEIFRKYNHWNLESDTLDSGFNKQYHGLYDFMLADSSYRSKMLSLSPPDVSDTKTPYRNAKMTEEQEALMSDIISARDYFLLWGPPGTGKTSIMMAALVNYYFNETEQQILLLAYTNRAVDEICSAIHESLCGDYIRIGSRYSTGKRYRSNLLSNRIEGIESREKLRHVFSSQRVFVSTISSFQGKREIKALKKFDLVIIDEASQLLEPMLVGLLSAFKKFILIGDHKQLPAVVIQSDINSKVNSTELIEEVGLVDTRISLFERMYKQAQKNNWDWAYGRLTKQGRMHQELVSFVSKEFYGDQLNILNGLDRLTAEPALKAETKLQQALVENRLIFVDTPKGKSITRKTNLFEAEKVIQVMNEWRKIYELNELPFEDDTLGVITPFRSQIAMIKSQDKYDANLPVTIDTIERYQGGARNHIIISLAVNDAALLESISNVSEEGIDRKLNVALTRAREHIVVIGNKEILMRKDIYRNLISRCTELELK